MAAGRAAAEGDGPAAKVANKVAESPKAAPAKRRAARAPVKRDAAATRQRILDAARRAFCDHGYEGARVDRIAAAARANVQMLYRYYGGKEDLYLAVLEDTYASIRTLERELDLAALPPVEGMRRLVEFTFDYLRDNPDFAAIIRNENMMGGRFVRKLAMVPDTTTPLMAPHQNCVRHMTTEQKAPTFTRSSMTTAVAYPNKTPPSLLIQKGAGA